MGTVRIAPCISTAKAGTVSRMEMSARPLRALINVEIMMFPTSTSVDISISRSILKSDTACPSTLDSTRLMKSICCTESMIPLISPPSWLKTPAVMASGPPIHSMASL